jgi:nicotinate-nucleotide pyrophosphorylase (carboxylating)
MTDSAVPPLDSDAAASYGHDESTAAAALIALALAEDLGRQGDRTGEALFSSEISGRVEIRNRVPGVVCGLPVVEQVFEALDPGVRVVGRIEDGQSIETTGVLATLEGPLRSLLAGERTALNFLGHLSGIATQTAAFVSAVAGTKTRILDTRKTLPGWRRLAKYAVRCGGGSNHRIGLFDGVLIKDNHLAGRRRNAGPDASVAAAVSTARTAVPQDVPVQVEVDTLDQLADALRASPDLVLLDNMTAEELVGAVAVRDRDAPAVLLEASGGITLATVAAVAASGVDRISLGALTHSATNWDVGFDWSDPPPA